MVPSEIPLAHTAPCPFIQHSGSALVYLYKNGGDRLLLAPVKEIRGHGFMKDGIHLPIRCHKNMYPKLKNGRQALKIM